MILSREFQKAALQRYNTAVFLLKHEYNLDAMYLAGYTVECALKALIMEIAPALERIDYFAMISGGSVMHYPERLGPILKALGRPVPPDLVTRFRRSDWSTTLRYESGRTDSGETRAFLKTAKATYDWVEGQLP